MMIFRKKNTLALISIFGPNVTNSSLKITIKSFASDNFSNPFFNLVKFS